MQNLGSRRLALAGNIKLMPATKSFVTQIPLAASSARRRSSNYARFSIFTERKLMLFCNPYIVLSWGFRLSVKVNDVVGNEAILLPRKIMKLLFFRSRSPTSTIILLEKKHNRSNLWNFDFSSRFQRGTTFSLLFPVINTDCTCRRH